MFGAKVDRSSGEQERVKIAPAILAWPFVVLVSFFGVPFYMLFRVSFAHFDPVVYMGTGWSYESYLALTQPFILEKMAFSLWLAISVAVVSILVSFPATYFIVLQSKGAQVSWLVGLLATLAFSEVLITFAWQILMSRNAGISNLFVRLGFLDKPVSLSPSFCAVVTCLSYVTIPLNVMALYPGLSRLDPSLMEAARTLGAKPHRAFFNILIPLMRKSIATAFLMTIVFSVGAYVAPLVLGGPTNWTIGVVISELAISAQNLPQAAAVSVLLLVATIALVVVVGKVGLKGQMS